MSDIVDDIDALVDEQLEGGPVDDYNADRYDRCPHCDRHRHGLKITERVAHMYSWGEFDKDYRAADDNSRVLCEGSDFIGPMPSENNPYVEANQWARNAAALGPDWRTLATHPPAYRGWGIGMRAGAPYYVSAEQAADRVNASIAALNAASETLRDQADANREAMRTRVEGRRVAFTVGDRTITGVVTRVEGFREDGFTRSYTVTLSPEGGQDMLTWGTS